MRVVVDMKRCESNAICMGVAPEIFQLDDDDELHLLNPTPPDGDRELVLQAIRLCPKQAISLEET